MANTIQIKRAGATGSIIPTSLAVGEMAYAENGSKLYIGTSGSTITEVGGAGGFAGLASPTFTGIPLAPTAASSVNTTQIATTAFVATAVANLINSAPAALDTLDELAASLNDDVNFATTMTNSLAGKLSTTATIDGGTF
jgi:hypothetical protein